MKLSDVIYRGRNAGLTMSEIAVWAYLLDNECLSITSADTEAGSSIVKKLSYMFDLSVPTVSNALKTIKQKKLLVGNKVESPVFFESYPKE